MMCCVITRYHGMVGVDFHATQPTFPIPPPIPVGPHFAAALCQFGPWWMAKTQVSTTVDTAAGRPLAKIFDIGMLIPQLGFNSPFLMFLLALTSSSQGHWGASKVQIEINGESAGPVAAALMLFANPQLNCGDVSFYPVPMPTGLLLAPNTVVAGLSIGDVVAGFLSMRNTIVVTVVLGALMNKVGGPLVKWFGNRQINNMTRELWFRMIMRGPQPLRRLVQAAFYVGQGPHVDKLIDLVLGAVVGSPVGYGVPGSPAGGLLSMIQGEADAVGQEIDAYADQWGLNEYFNDTALIPTYPFAVPASSVETPLALAQGPLDYERGGGDALAPAADGVSEILDNLFNFNWGGDE